MSGVNVLAVMDELIDVVVVECQDDQAFTDRGREARAAVAELIEVVSMVERHMTETGFACECGEQQCKTTRIRAALARVGAP